MHNFFLIKFVLQLYILLLKNKCKIRFLLAGNKSSVLPHSAWVAATEAVVVVIVVVVVISTTIYLTLHIPYAFYNLIFQN